MEGLIHEGAYFQNFMVSWSISKNMNSARTKGLAVAGIHNKNQHAIVTMLYFELLFTIRDILHNRFMKSNFNNNTDLVKMSHTLQMSDGTLTITRYSQ